jgi:transcription factor E
MMKAPKRTHRPVHVSKVKTVKKVKRTKTRKAVHKAAVRSHAARKGVVKKIKETGHARATTESKSAAHNADASSKKDEDTKKMVMGLPGIVEAKEAIDLLVQNEKGMTYLKKNVSRSVVDVINLLTTPRTDEYITEKLGIKINAVRRMLNIMQNYGITNYYISKNKNGWLSFAWYMNTGKLPGFLEYVKGIESEKSMIKDDCNDYFFCNNCYKENKLVFTFDAAYEAGFSCNTCGKNLERLGGKSDVEKLISAQTSNMKELPSADTPKPRTPSK